MNQSPPRCRWFCSSVFVLCFDVNVKMGDNGDSSATAAANTDLASDTTSSTIASATTSSILPVATGSGTITTPTALVDAGESTCLFPGGIAVPIQNASSWQTSGCSLGFNCKSSPQSSISLLEMQLSVHQLKVTPPRCEQHRRTPPRILPTSP